MSGKTTERQPRKSTVWTREKISHLILLYREHECLWNHYVESYTSKEHRQKAIDNICNTLRITKFDFGKKIHNLRNQFNAEMKKLERRIEESGDNPAEIGTSKSQRCRWEHFESLLFLRTVIERRRSGYQSNFQLPKKMRLKYDEDSTSNDPAAETRSEYHIEDATEEEVAISESIEGNGDDFQTFAADEQDAPPMEQKDIYDQKYNPIPSETLAPTNKRDMIIAAVTSSTPKEVTTTNKTYFTCIHPQQQQQKSSAITIQSDFTHEDHQQMNTASVLEVPTNNNNSSGNAPNSRDSSRLLTSQPRDQWDTFGELIANEFRLLNSDASRKKLKRKIMQVMLDVGEEDDGCSKV